MTRTLLRLLAIMVAGVVLAYIATRQGYVLVRWEDYEIYTTLFAAMVAMVAVLLVGSIVVWCIGRATTGMSWLAARRQKLAHSALFQGVLLYAGGQKKKAAQMGLKAKKLLRARPAFQKSTAYGVASLLSASLTKQHGRKENLSCPTARLALWRATAVQAYEGHEDIQALSLATRALKKDPKLLWAHAVTVNVMIRQKNWLSAWKNLASARKNIPEANFLWNQKEDKLATSCVAAMWRHRMEGKSAEGKSMEGKSVKGKSVKGKNSPQDIAVLRHALRGTAPHPLVAGMMALFLLDQNKPVPSLSLLAKCWQRHPHICLAQVFLAVTKDYSDEKRYREAKAFIKPHAHHEESLTLLTQVAARAQDDATLNKLLPKLPDFGWRHFYVRALAQGYLRGEKDSVKLLETMLLHFAFTGKHGAEDKAFQSSLTAPI